jgi:hypothetical protein
MLQLDGRIDFTFEPTPYKSHKIRVEAGAAADRLERYIRRPRM